MSVFYRILRHVVVYSYGLGLNISYDRILVLSTQLGRSACTQVESEGVICPTKLCSNVFTTFSVDNIDHNPVLVLQKIIGMEHQFLQKQPEI